MGLGMISQPPHSAMWRPCLNPLCVTLTLSSSPLAATVPLTPILMSVPVTLTATLTLTLTLTQNPLLTKPLLLTHEPPGLI